MSLARSYAQALYDFATESSATAESLRTIQGSLERFSEALEQSPELNEVLVGPSTSTKEKVAVVEAVSVKLSVAEPARRLLVLMARKERLRWLGEVVSAFAQVRLAGEGIVTGSVLSAEALGPQDLEQVEAAFGRKLGKKVVLEPKVDPELLAGLAVTVAGVTYDGTLRAQLNRLKEKLMTGGASQA
jgi:F-type H+-transporting ATPase subunit delta